MLSKNKSSLFLCLLLVLSLCLQSCLPVNAVENDITLTPLKNTSTGISLDTKFRLDIDKEIDNEKLKTYITVDPKAAFEVHKEKDKQYILEFNNKLEPDMIYSFEYNDGKVKKTWAYQTVEQLKLITTTPRDKSSFVPIKTGIELHYNNNNYGNIEEKFSIEPKVNGKFEYHDNTVVFIPDKLEYETTYIVEVEDGLNTEFSFVTKENPFKQKDIVKGENVYKFSEEDVPVLTFYGDKEVDVDVNVYKYNDADEYINDIKKLSKPYWSYESSNELVSTNRDVLESCMTFEGKIADDYLMFPDNLNKGLYLVDVKSAKDECQVFIQITDVVCYYTSDESNSLIWLNNLKDKKPISNAEVIVEDIGKGYTKQDGTLILEGNSNNIKEEKDLYLKVKENNQLTYVELIPYMSGISWSKFEDTLYPTKSYDYYSYLYTDREAYYPNDTINIWGVIKPRKANSKTDDLSVSLCKLDYRSGRVILYKEPLKIDEFNTIRTSMKVKNLNSGSFYYLIVQQGEEDVVYKSINITNIKKPSYRIDISTDKVNSFNWEDINVDVKANFFEGTPLPKFKYKYYLYNSNHSNVSKGVCDKYGKSKFKIDKFYDTDSWHPIDYSLSVKNDEISDTEVHSNCIFLDVYPRDTMLNIADKISKSDAEITINTNKISLKNVRNRYINSYEDIKGEEVDIPVETKVYEIKWIKEETGKTYDYVNKEVITKYDYKASEKLLDTYNLKTNNGKVSFDINLKEDTNYKIVATCKDSRGKKIIEEHNIRLYSNYYYMNDNKYTLKANKPDNKYNIGDTVSFELNNKGKSFNNPNGRMLYMLLSEGFVDYKVLDKDIKFEFEKKYLPNVFIRTIYFDGNRLYKLYDENLQYDYEQKRLNIDVKTEFDDYKPGDEVNLEIHVTDKDLNPCKAQVNLSIVDEAFFQIFPQHINMLEDLYRNIYDIGITCEFLSDRDNNLFGGAEKGSGSDSEIYIRKDFKDTALFKSVTTDKNGNAKVKFKLPDNLTNWRITCLAFSKDLQAGKEIANINSKLPFFISVISDDVYMNDDIASMLYKVAGTKVDPNKKVLVSSIVYKDGKKINHSHLTIGANNKYYYAGQSVKTGDYRVVITATQGKYSDSLEKKFKVVDNRVTFHKTDAKQLNKDIKIDACDNLTSLTFYNEAYGKHYEALNSLMYQYGNRVDKRLVSNTTRKWLNDKYDEDVPLDECNFYDYQRYNGGISLLPYSDSEIELTAKCCLVDAEKFEQYRIKDYFYHKLKDDELSNDEKAAIYCGLSFLGEQILPQIKNIDPENMTVKEKLYYTIALAKLGDHENAKTLYDQVIKQFNKSMDSYNYLDISDEEKCLEYTALGLVAAVIINEPEKDGFYDYLIDHSTKENSFEVEKLIYILNTMPNNEKQSSFEYTIGSKKKNVVLNKGRRYKLLLNRDQINKLKFDKISGNIEVLVGYDAPITENQNKTSEVKFTKKIGENDVDKIKLSDVTLVTLDIDFTDKAPEGFYEITDMLPSGFRFIQLKDNDMPYYFQGKDGQKLKFGCNCDKDEPSHIKIQYYIRPVTVGKYKADHSVIIHSKSNLLNYTDQKVIEVEPLYENKN